MKKYLSLGLSALLCAVLLSGCSREEPASAPADGTGDMPAYTIEQTAVPEGHGEEDQSRFLEQQPTLEPLIPLDGAESDVEDDGEAIDIDALLPDDSDGEDDAQEPSFINPVDTKVIDPNSYQFSALTDTKLEFTFNYPTGWQNVPGLYTVCYKENRDSDTFPARIAITRKDLVHSVQDNTLTDELTSFVQAIRKQYAADTFQMGTVNTNETFMGRPAYSNTYLAYSGNTEVKGFIIGCAAKKTVMVLHFCADYDHYAELENVMRYMVNSVKAIGESS